MKDFKIKLLISLIIMTVLSSCSEQEVVPAGEFDTGVVVINEGNFSDANGSVSFYNEASKQVTQDIFAVANDISVGGLIQSVFYYDDRAFIIDNLGSKIYVVDAGSYELITTIEQGLNAPRYMTVVAGRAYVTNWGSFDENFNLPDSYVSVIDLASYEELSSIATDSGCEGVLGYGGKVYVANSFSNTVDIIDPSMESVTGQIVVETGPVSFKEDKNGAVWLMSSDFSGPSYLSKLDLNAEEVINSIALAPFAKSLNINGSGDVLYYLSAPYGEDTGVYSLGIEAAEAGSEPMISMANIYGLGIHPVSGEIYLANHNAFQGNGTVLIYEGSSQKSSFAAGVGPNGFVFR